MTKLDAVYVALLAILLAIDGFVLWPSFVKLSAAEPVRARVWWWVNSMVLLWTMAGAGMVVWLLEGRRWSALRIVAPHGWRIAGMIAMLLAVALYYARSVATVARAALEQADQAAGGRRAASASHAQ